MTPQQMMEEIDRLARLCEAKDSEIAETKQAFRIIEEAMRMVKEQLSEAQAQIAMQAKTLKTAESALRSYQYGNSSTELAESVADKVCETISATSETALAYEREVENRGAVKELEELKHRVDSSGLTIVGILDTMLAELRAANKGEVK